MNADRDPVIYNQYKNGMSQDDLAKRYGLVRGMISYIVCQQRRIEQTGKPYAWTIEDLSLPTITTPTEFFAGEYEEEEIIKQAISLYRAKVDLDEIVRRLITWDKAYLVSIIKRWQFRVVALSCERGFVNWDGDGQPMSNYPSKGRPIDMGGPRDVWIDKDP